MADRSDMAVLLFDFFGTLVTYEDDRTVLRYDRTHELLLSWGCTLTHDEFVTVWDEASTEVETASGDDHIETTMTDAALAFAACVGLDLDEARCDGLVEVFLDEWAMPVRAVAGAAEMLARLGGRHRLGVVSNTHDLHMVGRLLDRLGMASSFEHVLLSVQHGWRKPHPSIYAAALDHFGVDPAEAVFVGDSYEADHLGPTDAGIRAFLIDPAGRHPVPSQRRLDSVLDLEARLGS
ncbi:HAD family hydrolase [Actinomarinicola tropica]|uniref:HAD-IA family hydrolase n=1 Tax=Actinomarinicola tropica TaxID=2789776 RepID=A0A5Q2RGK0_9ACTN|nr:HAD family hydrolase [Actinomarinicola tropica]QGG95938.1 HAD-IA family hydrolase [Actinomarinicola tropica]